MITRILSSGLLVSTLAIAACSSDGNDVKNGGAGSGGAGGASGPESGGSGPAAGGSGQFGSGGGAINDEPLVEVPATQEVSTGEDFRLEMAGTPVDGVTYALETAPSGMRIKPSGVITWHPTADQVGSFTVTVTADVPGAGLQSTDIEFSVTLGVADPVGIYVSPDGNDSGAGTASDPYLTLSHASDQTSPGDTVYVRGGVYRNATYGSDDINNGENAMRIATPGTQDQWVTYRPLGNEHAKIEYDGYAGIRVIASYIIIDGFEIEGPAAQISYEEAISHWWDEPMPTRYDNAGITTNRDHAIVRNCVIHHASSRGLGGYNVDHITYENNIVYNSSWWTFHGTHGVSIPAMSSSDGQANVEKIVYRGNLAFGNEQRIMSRVWSKGLSDLVVDEGYGFHIQDSGDNHQGLVTIEENLSLFNGKAGIGINTVENVTLSNNATYENARTTRPGSNSGITLQAATNAVLSGNLMHAGTGSLAFQTMGGSTATYMNNFAVRGKDETLPDGITDVLAVFAEPTALNFNAHSNVSGAGISTEVLQRLANTLADYAISVEETGYVMDYEQLSQDIVEGAPAEATVILTDYPDTVTVRFPAGSSHPAAPGGGDFVLHIHHPY